MKKTFLIALTCSSYYLFPDTNSTSQTFMFYRPLLQNTCVIEQGWGAIIAHKQAEYNTALQVIGLYQETRSDKTASYFLMNCQKELLVAGDDTDYALTRDVRAEWLNLPSNFSGTLSVCPQQYQAGALLCVNHDLKTYFSGECFESWWLSLKLPIYTVKNNLHLMQSHIQNPRTEGPGPRDILQAMGQYSNAAMDNCSRRATGLGELAITLGGTFLAHYDAIITWYAGLSIATEKKQKPDHLFNPFMGNNGHSGITYGFYCELPLATCANNLETLFFLTVDDYYLFKNHQHRTFDLWNKQWSRYLPYRNIHTGEVVQGTTLLTQQACVKPHNFVDLCTGLKFRRCHLELEVGYNLWAHKTEQVCIACPPCDKGESIMRDYGIAGTGNGTANNSTIAQLAPNDPTPTGLFKNDIQPKSGAGKGGYTNKLHVAASYHKKEGCMPLMISLGAFFEKPHTNFAFEQWGAWFKFIGEF